MSWESKGVRNGEVGVVWPNGGESWPLRLRENFFGFAAVLEVGGLASPLFWAELVAVLARDDGILEVLL